NPNRLQYPPATPICQRFVSRQKPPRRRVISLTIGGLFRPPTYSLSSVFALKLNRTMRQAVRSVSSSLQETAHHHQFFREGLYYNRDRPIFLEPPTYQQDFLELLCPRPP